MSRIKHIKPAEGLGATERIWKDRLANTIVKVSSSGKTFWMRKDKAIKTNKISKSGKPIFKLEPDEEGFLQKVTLRHDGRFRTLGQKGSLVIVGQKREYYDDSF